MHERFSKWKLTKELVDVWYNVINRKRKNGTIKVFNVLACIHKVNAVNMHYCTRNKYSVHSYNYTRANNGALSTVRAAIHCHLT